MKLIEIDEEKCIHCNVCIENCPAHILENSSTGIPMINNCQMCIKCGHCSALCPTGAFNHLYAANDKNIIPKENKINKDTAELFMRSRRSIRSYKDITVSHEKIEEVLNMAIVAPTASNSQNISYLVIDKKELLLKIAEHTVEWMEQEVKNNSDYHFSLPTHINAWRNLKIDTILRQAPVLILALADKDFVNGRQNAISQLSYLELYAPVIGLGSCWAGLLEKCVFSHYQPLLDVLSLPGTKAVVAAIMLGYPKYKFQKIPERNPLQVNYRS